jgi:ankyrin repeat protein
MAFSALETGDLDMIEMLLVRNPDLAHVRDLNGMSLLRAAVFRGRPDVVEMLLPTAGPLDALEAATLGDRERLVEILDAGEASPDTESPEGFGLLHLACFFGRTAVVELLLGRGAPAEAIASHPMGVRPVHSAAAGRHHDLVRLLLDRGAKVSSPQAGGWTLLHHAAQQGDRGFAEDLLARGADRTAENDRGQTPADVARALDHDALADLLSAEG